MTRRDNIFYKLTRENENSITELFCNLLRTKFIRHICLKFIEIPETIIKTINIENITTQKYLDEGIPDIIIKNDNCYYIIENKIRKKTELQDSQKNSYIERLEKEKGKNNKKDVAYIFIVPKEYDTNEIECLKEELKEKHGDNFIRFYHWEEYLKYLLDFEIQKESPIINESLNYFIKVISNKTSLYDEDTTLTPYEVAMLYNLKDVYESLNLCNKILSKIKSLEKDFLDFDKNLKPGYEYTDTKRNGIGKYFHYNGKEDAIFIGLNLNLMRYNIVDIHDITKKAEDYVFSMAFKKKDLKSELNIPLEKFFDDDDWIYIPLNKKYLLEENQMKTEIIDIFRDVFLNNVA
jgi:hypothetical protein